MYLHIVIYMNYNKFKHYWSIPLLIILINCVIILIVLLKEIDMKIKEIIKRYLTFIIGMFIIGMGIAFTRHAKLGVSPVSSVPNVLSYKFTFFSLGQWLTVTNIIFVIIQILILRKNFKLYQLLQIPASFISGIFTDFNLKLISNIPTDLYLEQLTITLLGVLLLSLGIVITVLANVLMNAAETLVKAISDTTNKNFVSVKIIFDVSWVVFSIVLSLIFFDFKIVGTREGTVIAAILTGYIAKILIKAIKPFEKYLKG